MRFAIAGDLANRLSEARFFHAIVFIRCRVQDSNESMKNTRLCRGAGSLRGYGGSGAVLKSRRSLLAGPTDADGWSRTR